MPQLLISSINGDFAEVVVATINSQLDIVMTMVVMTTMRTTTTEATVASDANTTRLHVVASIHNLGEHIITLRFLP